MLLWSHYTEKSQRENLVHLFCSILINCYPADGAAALLILVEHDHKRLVIANSGDERAVLARGEVISLGLALSTCKTSLPFYFSYELTRIVRSASHYRP